MKKWIRKVGPLWILSLVVLAVPIYSFRPPVSERKLRRLKFGQSEREVISILGKPMDRLIFEQAGSEIALDYRVPFRFGWVTVRISRDEGFQEYNYERY